MNSMGASPPVSTWPSVLGKFGDGRDLAIIPVEGGLFNRVYRVDGGGRTFFLKTFVDIAETPGFPPLPTTSRERFLVATAVHLHARSCPQNAAGVFTPALVEHDEEGRSLAMEAVHGIPLQGLILDSSTYFRARQIGHRVISWARRFHSTSCPDSELIQNASTKFKAYKAELQYSRLFKFVPSRQRGEAELFLRRHLQDVTTVLHGDLNSRNVIVCEDGRIAIIDFEQGQLASGVHDVAYLLSEYVIAALRLEDDPEDEIERFWLTYEGRRRGGLQWKFFRQHLAFQVLYRIEGPSRRVWSGHLDEEARERVVAWSRKQFGEWLC